MLKKFIAGMLLGIGLTSASACYGEYYVPSHQYYGPSYYGGYYYYDHPYYHYHYYRYRRW